MDCAFIGGGVRVILKGSRVEVCGRRVRRSAGSVRMCTEPDFGEEPTVSKETLDSLDEEKQRKKKEADRLRAAEKFIEIDEGIMECINCGYVYDPKKGDGYSGIPKGTMFEDLPSDFSCPTCQSPKRAFFSVKKVVAGFSENQKYGFGGNTLTEGQKSSVIFGGLFFFGLLLLSGYLLN